MCTPCRLLICSLFEFNYRDAGFALTIGTQTKAFYLPMALEMAVHSRTQNACALAVDDGHPLKAAQDRIVQEAVYLQQRFLHRLTA